MPEYPPANEARFGRFILVRRLASGGTAELFLASEAHAEPDGTHRVVKRLLPSVRDDPGFVARLLEEGRIGALISHPNLVQVFDSGTINGQAFLAMEHVD